MCQVFWGFPGKRNFEHLAKLFREQWYQRFAAAVSHITPAIHDQVYRQSRWKAVDMAQVWEERNEGASGILQEEESTTHCRGYFEVLVVGVEQDAHGLASVLTDLRSPTDSFTYSMLVRASRHHCSDAAGQS